MLVCASKSEMQRMWAVGAHLPQPYDLGHATLCSTNDSTYELSERGR